MGVVGYIYIHIFWISKKVKFSVIPLRKILSTKKVKITIHDYLLSECEHMFVINTIHCMSINSFIHKHTMEA